MRVLNLDEMKEVSGGKGCTSSKPRKYKGCGKGSGKNSGKDSGKDSGKCSGKDSGKSSGKDSGKGSNKCTPPLGNLT